MSKITEALSFAAEAHEGQFRKNGKTPYILHPIEVAAIIGSYTDNEDVIISGLLHDVIEDAGVTPDEIEKRFGSEVRRLVEGETENKRKELPSHDTWKLRKEESLEMLKQGDIKLKMLWLGDKLSNIRSIYRMWRENGDAAFNIFHQKDKKEHEWYYRKVGEYISELSDTAAYAEYTYLTDAVFGSENIIRF